jgi:hypothetical protein
VVLINLIIATALVQLTGPGGQIIDVNPAEIVSLREPQQTGYHHFENNVHCVINTVDGKFIAVIETCDIVRQKINEEEKY